MNLSKPPLTSAVLHVLTYSNCSRSNVGNGKVVAVIFHSLFTELPLHKFEIHCPSGLYWLSQRGICVQLIEHGFGNGQLTRTKTKMVQYLELERVRHRMYGQFCASNAQAQSYLNRLPPLVKEALPHHCHILHKAHLPGFCFH